MEHILATNEYKDIMKIRLDWMIIICVAFVITQEETIIHILWECPKVQEPIDNLSFCVK